MDLLPIHRHPEYLEDCCALINMQWPRSRTARMRSLTSSCDSLPTSLVLVNGKEVLGHSKLSSLYCLPYSCFVETVVVHPEKRGRGYGRILMEKTEEYARSLGIQTMYLTTHEQEGFYSKLGYTVCPSIPVYGSLAYAVNPALQGIMAENRYASLFGQDVPSRYSTSMEHTSANYINAAVPLNDTTIMLHGQCASPPPPPPPPPSPSTFHQAFIPQSSIVISKIYMKKNIAHNEETCTA